MFMVLMIILKRSHVIANLIKKFHKAKIENQNSVTIWGTGKPTRDFIYVDDVADACIFLMNNYNSSDAINIGSGCEVSIQKLASFVKKQLDLNVKLYMTIQNQTV